jgi:hypothetical protein
MFRDFIDYIWYIIDNSSKKELINSLLVIFLFFGLIWSFFYDFEKKEEEKLLITESWSIINNWNSIENKIKLELSKRSIWENITKVIKNDEK